MRLDTGSEMVDIDYAERGMCNTPPHRTSLTSVNSPSPAGRTSARALRVVAQRPRVSKSPYELSELELLEAGADGWDRFAALEAMQTRLSGWQPTYDPINNCISEGSRRASRMSTSAGNDSS